MFGLVVVADFSVNAQESGAWQYSPDLLQPFWNSNVVEDESVLFLRENRTEDAVGSVLFPIKKIVSVESSSGEITYEAGVDYRFEPGARQIVIPVGSRIVTSTSSDLRRPANSQRHRLTHRDGNGEILFGAKLEYHQMQTRVTYEKMSDDWPVQMPAFDPAVLPNTLKKLRDRKPLSVVLLGDSISTGCNASGWGNGAPYQPAYQDLLVQHLRAHYQTEVTLTNLSVGGTSTPWGVTMIDKVAEHNPDLVILAFGMNDSAGRSAKEYGQNTATMIAKTRALVPEAEFILVASMLGNRDWVTLKHDVFPKYRDELAELREPGVALADMTSVWEEFFRRKKDADLTGNGVNHPNDFGHRVYAQILSALLVDPSLAEAKDDEFKVGMARVNITPDYPILLNGFLSRQQVSTGVRQPIWAKAMAIEGDDPNPLILITVDTLGIPAEIHAEVCNRLKRLGVEPTRVAITATHTHTAPIINGCAPNIMARDFTPQEQKAIDQYTREFTDHLTAVATSALKNRHPATLQWSVGKVEFAKNRRDNDGPIDHELPVLAVRDEAGTLIGVYTSYACHCVTLAERMIGGDWAGYAVSRIENAHPDCIAMCSVGCGGDQNPSTRGSVEIAISQGELIAAEVSRLLQGEMTAVQNNIRVGHAELDLLLDDLPSQAEFTERAKLDTPLGYHAKKQLEKINSGEPLRESIDYPVQVWSFGDALNMVFLAGEVTVEYGIELKTQLPDRGVWVNAYANACPCYIPSEKVLQRGGYEGSDSMIYYDQPTKLRRGLEKQILSTATDLCRSLVGDVGNTPVSTDAATGKSPQQSLGLLQLADDELTVTLVASEPLIASPVAVDFTADGKVYVAEMYDYPAGIDGNYQPGGRVRLLTSSRDDGNWDQSKVFLDGIPFPTGVTVWRDGVLVCAAPDILYAEDQDNDGRADLVKKLFTGFGDQNYQARVNSLEYGLDGWVYGSCGLFGGKITSLLTGKTIELGNSDFRIRPDTGEIERAVGRTQQGRVRDDFGNWYGCDNTKLGFHYPLAYHYLCRNPLASPTSVLKHLPATSADATLVSASRDLQLFEKSGQGGKATAACGIGIYRDRYLGPAYTGGLYTCEPVNLLVHHLQLSPNRSSFSGSVIPSERKHAFLSSTDPSFRPVQARTAPDGTLWVVDMYREVIEHPKWIPPSSLAKVDVRGGADQGRIYRVSRAGESAVSWPRLDKLSANELVATLESKNGWQRDMAMQLLQWNQAVDTGPALRKLARESTLPAARVAALSLLTNSGILTLDDAVDAFEDDDANVRRHAVRVAETLANGDAVVSATVLTKLLPLATDSDAHVRLQVACSLGQWQDIATGDVLANMLLNNPDDSFLDAAIMSSLHKENVDRFAEHLVEQSGQLHRHAVRTFPVLFAMCSDAIKARLALAVSQTSSQRLELWQWKVLPTVLEHFERHEEFRQAFKRQKGDELIEQCLPLAIQTIVDQDQEVPLRVAALHTLHHLQIEKDVTIDVVAQVLNARNASEIQLAGVTALARNDSPDSTQLMIGKWDQVSPSVRAAMLDALTSRVSSIELLLEAIGQSEIRASEIDTASRQRIFAAGGAKLKSQAEQVFSGEVNADRAVVIAEYSGVSELQANASRGSDLFRKHCATCHRFKGTGNEVGPELEALASKPVEFFLQEILDPSRNMDTRYATYVALTDSGRIVTGLLAAESGSAITLRLQEAKEETLQRSELEDFRSNQTSLMPEGFEKSLDPQQMADLIHYIRSAPPSPN
ncbi:membrane-bound dehydrogenase domain protein [Rhodopirellula maiorica SM1]|uniref:Membrane-bound dehydrogenase domain protein n=1 Tax=Rhodopirellula maiorica SM1 TaxID=1265738 RepID=M5RFR5_9BACT|nr:membrane-bound dehydrogenase domain protein [Rhodopirellula maiorica SM1]